MEATQDAQLLRTVCEGSEPEKNKAMRTLYLRFSGELHRHFRRKNQGPDVATDLAHEVLIKVWKAACSFMGTAAVSSWIFRIANNHLVDLIRKEQREPDVVSLPEPIDEPGPEDPIGTVAGPIFDPEVDEHEQLRLIDEAMKLIEERTPERAEALRLVCIFGWTGSQLAEYLGRTERAAYEYVNQCKKKLRAAYAEVKQRDGSRGAGQ